MNLAFTAVVNRTELGLAPLNINDQLNYKVSAELFGGTVSWRRQVVKSPYVEGEYTVNRTRGVVEEHVNVEVFGDTQVLMNSNVAKLVTAFSQNRFNITITLDAAIVTYACEAADYSMDWSVPRMHARQTQVKFVVRRSPVPINGAI